MKLTGLRARSNQARPGVTGITRTGQRTDDLLRRIGHGDVVILDQVDLDRATAEALIDADVTGVVNASPSISGRFPNLGPEIVVGAGIVLIDGVGTDILRAVKEGTKVRLFEGGVFVGDKEIGRGTEQSVETVADLMIEAKAGMSAQLEAFSANTIEFLRRERTLILDGVGVPELTANLCNQQVLIVAAGRDHEEDLRRLKRYIAEHRPILIGVDGGADSLHHLGYRPNVIVGDPDGLSTDTLRSGAEVVVPAHMDGHAPGLERVQDLGIGAVTFPASGNSEDLALLLADTHGASLVVTVGFQATLREFLDRGRSGSNPSTFLTRLKLGSKVVDGKAVATLHRSRVSIGAVVLLVLAALIAVVVALAVSGVGSAYLDWLVNAWHTFTNWVGGILLVISLRYHVVSIAAVFLALAVGVVLGSTTLSRSLLSGLNNENEDLAAQVSDLENEKNAQGARLADADSFAASVGPMAVQGQLAQRTVVLVTTADANPVDRDELKTLIANAGGTVSGEVQLTESFSDPRHADQLKDIVVRLLLTAVQLPTASDPGTLAGGLLGPLLLISKDNNRPQASADENAAALSGLTEGGFIKASQGLQPAQLAIVLTGGAASGDGAGDRAATVARFATQVDRSGAGAVLAGNAGSASGTGPVGVVRADTAATSILSTVDNVQTSAGRVVTVLALREQLEGKSGRYGDAGNAERPAPGTPAE